LTRPVTVLYEDSAADGPVSNYGPHVFVCQCVGDELGVEGWRVARDHLSGNPRRGSARIRDDCRQNPSRFVRDGRLAFAVYDADRLPALLGLPASACKPDVKAVLLGECPWREQLCVVLLERNLETVLRALRECDPQLVDEPIWTRAIERKFLTERDLIFVRAAKPTPSRRLLRACAREQVPSLDYLVRRLVVACGA
jgi:hypothetical protein